MNININDSISNFIKNDFEKVLCVSGNWGVGKTYAVRKSIEKNKDIKCRYVSVFGMKTINDLIIALYVKTGDENILVSSLAKSGPFQALAGIAAGAFKNKTGVNDIFLEPLLAENIMKVDEGYKKLVVVIDDIERMNKKLDLDSLLGFISNHKDRENVKFILITNEDKMKKSNTWKEYKEKIIDRTLKIDCPSKDIYFSILESKNNSANHGILEKFGVFKITNLRTLLTFNNIVKINGIDFTSTNKDEQLISKLIMYALENVNNQKYDRSYLRNIKLAKMPTSFEHGFSIGIHSSSSEKNKESEEDCIKRIDEELQIKNDLDCLFDNINEIDHDVFVEVGLVEGKRILNEVYEHILSGEFEQIQNIKIHWPKIKKIRYVDNNIYAFFAKDPQSTAKNSLDNLENKLSDNAVSKISLLDVYVDLIFNNFEKYYCQCEEQIKRIEDGLITQAAQEMIEDRAYYNEIYYKVVMSESDITKRKLNDIFERFIDESVKEFNKYYIDVDSDNLYTDLDFFIEVDKFGNIFGFDKDRIIEDELCRKLFFGYCRVLSGKINMGVWSIVCENIKNLNKYNKLVDQLLLDKVSSSSEPLKERLEIIRRRFFNNGVS